MKKTPEILKVKAIVDKLNGAEFDYRIFKELKYSSVSISTLVKRGYIEIVRKHDTDDGRPFNIYKATGNVYHNYSLKKYNNPKEEEVLIFGKYKLSEIPKSAVTVHMMQG
jgi:hypothetical protein